MGRLAIVTGSDSGIGKATAVELARAGYDVGITWHEDEEGPRRRLRRSAGSTATPRCVGST